MTAFRIIIAAYQCAPWIERCIASLRAQRYVDWRAIVIDDHSPDATYERAKRAADGDARIVLQRAPERRRSLRSALIGTEAISDHPENVIVTLDGDDWLAHAGVLDVLARQYADPEVWLTYGSHRCWKNRLSDRLNLSVKRGIAREIPAVVARGGYFRQYPFVSSHLRSFKRVLWDAIRDEDLRDDDGQHWQAAADVAVMLPMLEMAGAEHIRYIDEVLYVYNHSNPMCNHHADPAAQALAACRIRARKPRAPLARRVYAASERRV